MKASFSTAMWSFIPFHARMKTALSWPARTDFYNHIGNVFEVRFPVAVFICANKHNSRKPFNNIAYVQEQK